MFINDNGICPTYAPRSPVANVVRNMSFSPSAVYDVLYKLPNKLSAGPDGVPTQFYKVLAPVLASPLAFIFNLSMGTGRVPSIWSKAKVVPVFKNKGNTASPVNYRPISLTDVACKVMETLVKNRIELHLSQNNLLSDCQHGFVRNKSTVTQLVECLNDWTNAAESHEFIDIAYLDIAKAFDTVSHPKLLFKLKNLGVDGLILSWLECFLAGRTQRVTINDESSDSSPVKSGVPQGSVLGPLLFRIYIDDSPTVVRNCRVKLFADDTKLYIKGQRNLTNQQLLDDLERIVRWAKDWQLSLSLQKCAILPIRGCRADAVPARYVVSGEEIPIVDHMRDLGYIVSADLKQSRHVSAIVKPAHKIACQINRAFVNRDVGFQIQMFKTFVRPRLEYASIIWNPYLKKGHSIYRECPTSLYKTN